MGTKEPDGTYQGWTNYETYIVHVWLTNDEGVYKHWAERAKFSTNPRELAEELEADYREAMPPRLAGVWRDLLIGAVQAVNWKEVAEAVYEAAGLDPQLDVLVRIDGQYRPNRAAVEAMDNDLRERLSSSRDWAQYANPAQLFVDAYAKLHLEHFNERFTVD